MTISADQWFTSISRLLASLYPALPLFMPPITHRGYLSPEMVIQQWVNDEIDKFVIYILIFLLKVMSIA